MAGRGAETGSGLGRDYSQSSFTTIACEERATIETGMDEVLAICTDLFFAVKIGDSGKRAGIPVRFLKSREALLEAARGGVVLIVLDLNCREVDCTELVRDLKKDPACAAIPVTAFVSHVQAELIHAARQAGCDRVLARSAFVKELDQIMRTAHAPS